MKAKMKLRRLWSILLTLVMVVAQLPTGQVVYAAELTAPNVEGNTIYANGFPILIEEGETSGTTVKYDSDKTAPYDYETVLTENNGNVLTVYAGGNAKGIDTASVLMTGGNVGNIYGGGYCYGSGGSSVGSVEITINGGNVGTINGGGNGKYVTNDGGSSSSVTTATITVNGGTVSTLCASSPSAGRECSYNVASAKISVAGGTISNIKENAGKSNNAGGNTVTVTGFVITGGSIASSDISLMPTNGEETPQNVSKMELTLKDKDEANNVTNEPLSTLTTDAGYPYGMNDVKTDANGKIYVWLPEGTSVSGAESTSGNKYVAGSVAGVLKHKETYTVSFHANGGSGTMSDVTEVLGEYTLPANGFTAPTGKQFKGWATSEDGEVIFGTTIDVSENTTLYAIWEDITYTVSFDANGGSGTMADVTEVLGEYTLPANGFTAPTGKQFKGWATSEDGEVISGTTIDVSENTTLYAIWEDITYTVSFDANGGSGTMADVTEVLGEYTLPANGFTAPEGKHFKCWSVGGVEKAVGDKINVTADTTVKAVWETTTYTVSFDANGGSGTMSDVTEVLGKYTLPTNGFTAPTGKQFKGWATSEDGEVISGTTIDVSENTTLYAIWEDIPVSEDWGDVVEEDRTLYTNPNEIPDTLWIVGVSDQDYSGKAITFPNMRVYYHKKLLKKGTDYTEKYASNIKVGTATIRITGRGNFNGSIMKSFKVNPLSLGDGETNNENLKVLDITLAYTGRVQKGTTTVTYMINGSSVTLKSGTDFTYQYSADYDYKSDGEHYITIKGNGNYSGTAKFKETIDSSKKLIAKMKLSKMANMNADGTALTPDVALMDGTYKLVKGTDYNLEWQNNVLPGTATVIITGMNDYAGTKTTTFKIKAMPISKAVVSGVVAQPYTGNKTSQSGYSLTYKADKNATAETLIEGTDYTVSYSNATNVGNKATIIFTGINRFSGTLKKTYTITPYALSDVDVAPLNIGTVSYQKNGATPVITVTVGGKILKNGTDYTLKYANNKSKNDGSNPKSIPTVTIIGKGNYKGTITRTFRIEGSSLAVTRMTATDIAYAQKTGICKPVITLYDTNHTKLAAGTDYDKTNIQYVYAKDVVVSHIDKKKNVTTEEKSKGTPVDLKNDIIPVGAEITVTVYGRGNYVGTEQSTTFRFVKTDISKATIKVNAQSYTGYELTPSKDEIVITMGKGKNAVELASIDYDIVSYTANINKGKASMTIHGLGNYGGTKTINFTINPKSMNYTIVFDKNSSSATGTMKNASITEGKALTANAYKWSGHTFKGWSYTPDGEVVFKNKDKFVDPTGRYGRTIILYAIWE